MYVLTCSQRTKHSQAKNPCNAAFADITSKVIANPNNLQVFYISPSKVSQRHGFTCHNHFMQCRSTQLRSETVIILVQTQKVQHERITKVSEWRSCEAMLISMTEEPVLCFTTGLILFKSSCGLRAMFLVMHGFT